jgi:hypothetical protein
MDREGRRERAQSHPPSWAAIYGEDEGPNLFTEQAPKPAKGSTAAQHAARVRRDEKDLAREREQIAEHFRRLREAEANDPLHGVPTSEIHAARALRRRQED